MRKASGNKAVKTRDSSIISVAAPSLCSSCPASSRTLGGTGAKKPPPGTPPAVVTSSEEFFLLTRGAAGGILRATRGKSKVRVGGVLLSPELKESYAWHPR